MKKFLSAVVIASCLSLGGAAFADDAAAPAPSADTAKPADGAKKEAKVKKHHKGGHKAAKKADAPKAEAK